MEIGTVVICRLSNMFTNYVAVVLENESVIRVSINDRSVEVKPENILSIVGINEDSIMVAKEHGRWMRTN